MVTSIQNTPTRAGCGNVATVHFNERVTDAARLMCEKKVGCLVAIDRDEKIVGIITERDILAWIGSASPSTFSARVGEVMTEDVLSISPEVSVEQARAIMAENDIRHLPVVQDGRAVGMISVRDVLKAGKS